jgi:hypothetical protein
LTWYSLPRLSGQKSGHVAQREPAVRTLGPRADLMKCEIAGLDMIGERVTIRFERVGKLFDTDPGATFEDTPNAVRQLHCGFHRHDGLSHCNG